MIIGCTISVHRLVRDIKAMMGDIEIAIGKHDLRYYHLD